MARMFPKLVALAYTVWMVVVALNLYHWLRG